MRSTTIVVACLLACALPFVMHSCRKDANSSRTSQTSTSASTNHVDSIITSGCNYNGDVVWFSYGITGTVGIKTLWWNFGDGAVSGSPLAATHIYSVAGTYDVTLGVNDDVFHKTIEIHRYIPGDNYTAHMGGTRSWYGSYNYYETPPYTPIEVVDSPFAVEVIDSGRIKCWNDAVLTFRSADLIDKKVFEFSDCWNESRLSYYYAKDSIVFRYSRQIGKSAYKSVLVYTP